MLNYRGITKSRALIIVSNPTMTPGYRRGCWIHLVLRIPGAGWEINSYHAHRWLAEAGGWNGRVGRSRFSSDGRGDPVSVRDVRSSIGASRGYIYLLIEAP